MNYKALSAVLGVAVIVLLWLVSVPAKDDKDQNSQKQSVPQVSQEDKDKLLQAFPPDFVVDKTAKEIVSDVSPDGQKISRVFQSQQTLEQILKNYADVMANLKWTQINKMQTAGGVTVVSYIGNGSSMNLALEKNDQGTKFTVTYYPMAAGLK